MRIIKFRGKTIKGGKWIVGDLLRTPGYSGDGVAIQYWDEEDGWMYEDVRVATVGQFTSLYDTERKEIYEGDILKFKFSEEDEHLEVRFVRGVFAFLWGGRLDDELPTCSPTHEWAEVIGNIHDNPELLRKMRNKEKK